MGYQLDFSAIAANLGLRLHGACLTVMLAALAATHGVGLSIGGGATRRWGPVWAQRLVGAYAERIRNTPFIGQLFFIFFGLPALGIKLCALGAAALAMTINLATYGIEIMRAGLEAIIPAGQREAGLALGLSPRAVIGLGTLPQAVAVVCPALVSQIIITILDSGVVSQIAVIDLTQVADPIQSRICRAFEPYFIVTLIYLAMALMLYACAFLAEIWRGCVDGIAQGQWDASTSPGLTFTPRMRLVILPQALKIGIPLTLGFLVQLVKSTALASITGFDALTRAGQIVANATYKPPIIYALVARICFAIFSPLTLAARVLKRRLRITR